ncbi:MAG: Ser-Thr-rich GPI-anchored membrane family protein [Syntrophobacteraceae bacterium]
MTSTTNSSYTATSANNFTITGPTIAVTSPNGGETWLVGKKYAISWSYTGSPGNVKIELIEGSAATTIVSNTSAGKNGQGSYSWTIPKNQASGNDYKVKVTSTTNSSCTYTSANNFTITGPTIALTSPNGGENWLAGKKHAISWSYTGSPGNVKIELLKGTAATTIVSSASAGKNGQGSYSWTIPKSQASGNDYKARVTSTTDSSCTYTSANNFTITGPTIALTSPNGGETWLAGKKYPISWSYTGSPGNVRIELLKGTAATTIVSSMSAGKNGQGSYGWTIPKNQASRSDYMVRVTSTSSSSCTSTSANTFTIKSGAQSSAGPDQKVGEATQVRLNGSNSTGVRRGVVSYQWSQIAGPKVELAATAAIETTFTAPAAGLEGKSLGFQLTVISKDGSKSKDSCIVNVTAANSPPTADAGPNQTVVGAEVVQLDGYLSSDPDDGIASYEWKQVSGIPVTLSDPSAIQPTFVAPDAGDAGESLTFELTVTDQGGLRSRDTCIVNVMSINKPPTAQAGPNQSVRPGTTVTLDGSGSMDEDSDVVLYRWAQTVGSPVALSDPTVVNPTFVAPDIEAQSEVLVFQLTVADARGLQNKDKVVVTVTGGGSGYVGTGQKARAHPGELTGNPR